MAKANRTWGEERIAADFVETRDSSVASNRQTLCSTRPRATAPDFVPGLETFVRDHAQAILACDFFVTVTASF